MELGVCCEVHRSYFHQHHVAEVLCLMDLGISLVQATPAKQGPTGAPGVGEKGYTGDRGATGAFKLPISCLSVCGYVWSIGLTMPVLMHAVIINLACS